ncbi:hypothetical protein [Burkholderia vietnamiensis]|uniref:hypothetical protein n=1 Tax=Burkholderia vietnamiensis TaxID=60552 RepID=UPI00159310D8|nr:hypothetical protein [Burkholderia vietnamiensis]MCA8270379.1 hypothetical protein [Burkholderia vietnamiensis]
MKRAVTVTRTAISSVDNIGRLYVMLFRHFFDAKTSERICSKARVVNCTSEQDAAEVMQSHRDGKAMFVGN